MAALVARRHNPVLKDFYQRLLLADRPKRFTIIAVASPLLVILNAIIRDKKLWQTA